MGNWAAYSHSNPLRLVSFSEHCSKERREENNEDLHVIYHLSNVVRVYIEVHQQANHSTIVEKKLESIGCSVGLELE